MSELTWSEWALPLLSLLLIGTYHLYLFWEVKNRSDRTLIGMSNHLRHLWVQSIIDERRDLLAVQTLRNWTMAATFLASTAVLIWLAMIHVTFSNLESPTLIHTLRYLGKESDHLWQLKWVSLMVLFFFTFVNFTLAVRHFNHVGFLINIPPESDERLSVDFVAYRLNRGATHHTVGMRGYYLSVPLVLWLFSAWWLLIGTLVLLWLLYKLDHHL